MASYRAAVAAFRDLGLRWDEAMLAIEIAAVLGADDPEREAWIDRGREMMEALGARPFAGLLDSLLAGRGQVAGATPEAASG